MWCVYVFVRLFILDTKMGRGVDMRFSSGPVRSKTYSSFLRYRPAFMERDMVAPSWEVSNGEYWQHVQMRMRGVSPPYDGRRLAGEDVVSVEGGDGVVRRRSLSPVPLKDDAGYNVGYLTDDEDDAGHGNNHGSAAVISRRRRELLGSDLSFTGCLFMFVGVTCLLMLFLFAVSPWGIPPPRIGTGSRY